MTERPSDNNVDFVEVSSPDDCAELAAVLARVWGMRDISGVIAPEALRAMAHSGCYVTGVRLVDRDGDPHSGPLVGGSFGWPSRTDGEWRLHSHVVGFLAHYRAVGLGARIKHHQRDWARSSGMSAVEWTYDPLVAANARFNLTKLGARVLSFHRHFYGRLDDEFSAGLGSDRFLVRWGVDAEPPGAVGSASTGRVIIGDRSPLLLMGGDGMPVMNDTEAAAAYAQIPADIVAIRRENRGLARLWADAFAATVGRAVTDGAEVVGITPDHGYLIDR